MLSSTVRSVRSSSRDRYYIIYVLNNTWDFIVYVLNYIAIYLLDIALCLLYIAVVRIYALCYDPAYSFKSNRIEYEVYLNYCVVLEPCTQPQPTYWIT